MIVFKFLEGQGLGNQLWCYTSSRSIAEKLGVEFKVANYEVFKGKGFIDLKLTDAQFIRPGFEPDIPIFKELHYYDPDLDYISSGFDSRVLNISVDCYLEGLFQSEEYFFGDPTRARRYLSVNFEDIQIFDGCILNIRGGEYKRHKNFNLELEYWISAMKNITYKYGVKKFKIVTDDPSYVKKLLPNIEVCAPGIKSSFKAMCTAKYYIVSNSTFSYFPILLNNNVSAVIAPMYFARPYNKLGRWASPANFYKGWQWQNKDGVLVEYDICKSSVDSTLYFYSKYNIVTHNNLFTKKRVLPDFLVKFVKVILSKLFPLKFG